jgi:hypothetical protein
MCSIYIDESTTGVHYCMIVMSLGTFSENLNRLYTPYMMHGSRSDALKWAPRSQRDVDYRNGVTS